ncbi:translation initiation factor IF-2-like [Colossoma macropomum]|uniref:translation initiation factor IF-2-like n=1 Tax=Colossoma macropomum TaxID=42526 RepID=UPI00186515F8|nr:translation initiation factor IF-2-like [Colossoma macropomum]
MVRLVFRPYTQVGRPICTSGPLRASTRVSSGFALPRHSSPSFGYHRVRSCSTSPTERERRAGGAPPRAPEGGGSHLGRRAPAFTFIAPWGFFPSPLTRARVRLLGPCFKTGRVGGRHRRRPRAPFRGPVPARAARRVGARTGDSPARSTAASEAEGPRPFPAGREGGRGGARPRPPEVNGEVGAGGRCKAGEPASGSRGHLRPLTLPSRTGAGRGAPPRRKCARRRPREPAPDGGLPPPDRPPAKRERAPRRGHARNPAGTTHAAGLNPPGGLCGPHAFTSQRFHALLNSLFKVLFNFPLRYLFAIGLVPVFSLRWSLPPALGCIPKQPDSEKNRTPAGRGPLLASHHPRAEPRSQGLRPPARAERNGLPYATFPRARLRTGGFGAGLFPLRSPLLGESLLVSFPPLSNMLKFSGSSRLI